MAPPAPTALSIAGKSCAGRLLGALGMTGYGRVHLRPNGVCGAPYAPIRTASRISPVANRNRGALRSTNSS